MKSGLVSENHLDNNKPKWFAVYTRYKREKLVDKALKQKGIECYLPLQKVYRQWERKKRVVQLPLINCYVFVCITKQEYTSVLSTEHIVKFVHFSKNLISIPEKEINLLKRILLEEVPVQVVESDYEIGDTVEITRGNLVGISGRLIRQQGKQSFMIELESIGCNLRMEIDQSFIEKK